MTGPLEGIRVLEFTQIIAGPFGCQNLADMGAEVIKVEPPEGEAWRHNASYLPGESRAFASLNRGKRSLVLRMQDPEAQRVIHDLLPDIDVVVINYRPDVPARLGIDYETLRAIRPDLIYVDNTAFGRRGPMAQRPGYDIVVQAVSGLMANNGKMTEDGVPVVASPAMADYGTGVAIAWGVCAALFHRERTGKGQMIESTLLATAVGIQAAQVMDVPVADATRRDPIRQELNAMREAGASYPELLAKRLEVRVGQAGGGSVWYRTYQTSNGAIAIGALSATLRQKVRNALGLEYLGQDAPDYDASDPNAPRQAAAAIDQVQALLRSRATEEWMEVFEAGGVPAGPVRFPEDMSTDPQVLANDLMVEQEHELSSSQLAVGPILKFSETPLASQGASPPLGRDTERILREMGYDEERIAGLRERGVTA